MGKLLGYTVGVIAAGVAIGEIMGYGAVILLAFAILVAGITMILNEGG